MTRLTETKLKAMPSSEYMNDVQLGFFKDYLQKLRIETETHIQEVRSELQTEDHCRDENDQATQEETRTLNLRIIDREAKFLKKIEQSLQDIDEGVYGYCEETGEPIGIARLLLRPTATLSVDAKSLLEEKEREFKDEHH